jgi:uroporphyrinogen-III synthase
MANGQARFPHPKSLPQAGERANDSLREPKANLALAGLNIVVTRPREQAVELAQHIARLGGKPVLFPLLEIAPASDARALHELAQHPETFDMLIFISPNAVKYGMAGLVDLPKTLRIAAVGQSSAQALRELGINRVIAPTERFDSEALLALPELQNVSGWRVAILRGDGGRELLGDTLKARGAQVDYITCYQRSKPHLDVGALIAAEPDAITVTSSEALAYLWQMLEEPGRTRLAAIPLFAPHARIAALARQQGWREVITTASGDDEMLAALIAWALTKRK